MGDLVVSAYISRRVKSRHTNYFAGFARYLKVICDRRALLIIIQYQFSLIQDTRYVIIQSLLATAAAQMVPSMQLPGPVAARRMYGPCEPGLREEVLECNVHIK